MIIKQVFAEGPFGIVDFSWDGQLPEFTRLNLIYGWNRSGKTTLSRIFEACERKSTAFDHYPETGTFSVVTGTGSRVRPNNVDSCALSIRVFNQDFIDQNVSFDSSAAEPIVYISEEDIAGKNRIDELRGATEALRTAKDAACKQSESSGKTVNLFYETTALAIKNTLGNLKVSDQYRTYDKRKLRAFLDGKQLSELQILSEDDLEALRAIVASAPKPEINPLREFSLHVQVGGTDVTDLGELARMVSELGSREVVSETLERLKDDRELNQWVKRGLDIQRRTGEMESCPYCEQPLDDVFVRRLMRHFSDDYTALESAISELLPALDGLALDPVEASRDLYPECSKAFAEHVRSINSVIAELNEWVQRSSTLLRSRLESPLAAIVPVPEAPADFKQRYDTLVDATNLVIGQHNEKAGNHGDEVRVSKDRWAEHLVAAAVEEQDLEDLLAKHEEDLRVAKEASDHLEENVRAIDELVRKTSNIGRALQTINGHLNDFFGRDEIQLHLDEESKGYEIRRCGRPAKSLSEGEKTALAFSYFIAKVEERDFKVREGVVVIDDPISSLDSNFIYHAQGLIRRHFSQAGQLFVLTHNFELFNLTKAWFNRRNAKQRRNGEPDACSFYTVENRVVSGDRRAHLAVMDETLRNFNSEYQYLFARLKRFADEAAPGYADLYTIGNIARRFLEIYAGFKIPTMGDLKSKVEQLPTTSVTDVQKEKVYRLVQEFSHGGDPTLAVVHRDRSEAQEAIAVLLRIVEESDGPHYALLARNIPRVA